MIYHSNGIHTAFCGCIQSGIGWKTLRAGHCETLDPLAWIFGISQTRAVWIMHIKSISRSLIADHGIFQKER